MKKTLISLLMAMMMLFSVAAFAEGEEAPAGFPDLYRAYDYDLELNVGGSLTEGMFEGQSLVVFCCTGEFGEPLIEMADEFNRITGSAIEVQIYSGTELITKINTALNGEETMDVFCYVTEFMKTWNSLGLLADMKALSEEYGDAAYNWDGFLAGPMQRGTDAEGRVFAVPFQICEYMGYYRADYLAEANMTMPEAGNDDAFVEVLEHFTRAINPDSPSTYGYATQYGSTTCYYSFCSRLSYYGGQMFDNDWNCLLAENDAAVKAYEFQRRLNNCGPVDNLVQWDWSVVNTAINEGDLFFAEIWTSAMPYITDGGNYDNIGFMFTYGDQPCYSGWALGVNEVSEKKELAWKYIEFCTSEDGEMTKLDEGCFPGRQSSYDRLIAAGITPEYYDIMIALLNNTALGGPADICMPYLGNGGNTILGEWTQKVYLGEADPAEAVDNICAEILEQLESVGVK